jgi:hypothetical protein
VGNYDRGKAPNLRVEFGFSPEKPLDGNRVLWAEIAQA